MASIGVVRLPAGVAIAPGNADAHHKNWSLIYPDGRRPRLAPANDQVSIVAWVGVDSPLEDNLPFKLRGSRRWEDVRALVEVSKFEGWIRAEIARHEDTLGVAEQAAAPGYRKQIERHWSRVPLFRG